MPEGFSTDHVDYLQRSGATTIVPDPGGPGTEAPPALRRLHLVKGVGRFDRDRLREQPAKRGREEPLGQPSQDLLVGLHGYQIPVAFLATGTAGGVSFHLGTWAPAGSSGPAAVMDARQGIVQSVLSSLYASVDAAPVNPEAPAFPRCGVAIGVPSIREPDPRDPVTAIDRLVRALDGQDWAVLVLAQPIYDDVTRSLRDGVLNELRAAQAEASALKAPSPLSEHYTRLLEGLTASLFEGEVLGAWRTAVYLLGTSESYARLVAAWTALYTGEDSVPEPVRVVDGVPATLAASWALPEPPVPAGPGSFRHPFVHQTLLTSKQLSAYVHLPERETPGFSVATIPGFDVVPHPVDPAQPAIEVGTVLSRGRTTATPYQVERRTLLKHTFVAGVTGAGKTNTVFSILEQADAMDVPFLVLEPAKTEYRALLRHPGIGPRLQVFTLGSDVVSPMRLNPFEVVGDTPVGVHLDLLRSLFTVSFGMWSPLPQLLEQALHRAYAARGWDVAANRNRRLEAGGERALAFPTLTDLLVEVERVISEQGWDEKITGDMRASLVTRINGLRQGGKGRMLDTARSLPCEDLFDRPSVLELESMGDDDDKAFVMGLLLIRLAEYRRQPETRNTGDLRHLLVIEEAHRLLANVGRKGGDEQADPRAKAVESFANLLAEVRAYGQGVVVADQVPVKLAPDVIKNTSLKIAHRIVDAEDRRTLGGSMAMQEAQERSLSILGNGEAAVFAEGDDAPVLVKIGKVKHDRTWPDDGDVAAHMAEAGVQARHGHLFLRHAGCTDTDGAACEAARRLVEDDRVFQRSVSRLALALVDDEHAGARLWPVVRQRLQRAMGPGRAEAAVVECTVARAAAWYADRRGADLGWSFHDTGAAGEALHAVLADLAGGSEVAASASRYRAEMNDRHRRAWDPLPACAQVCGAERCLFRRDVEELVAGGELAGLWARAVGDEGDDASRPMLGAWRVATIAAGALVGRDAPIDALVQAGLCFGQQALLADAGNYPEVADDSIEALLDEARTWLEVTP